MPDRKRSPDGEVSRRSQRPVRFRRDLGGGAELVWLEDDDELDQAAEITEADKQRAQDAWRRDARPPFKHLLDAQPGRPDGK